MIGGQVVEVIRTDERVWINVADVWYRNGVRTVTDEQCAIWVERTPAALCVEAGDGVWWQGRLAFWTPAFVKKGGKGPGDVKLNRIGYSGVKRPQIQEAA